MPKHLQSLHAKRRIVLALNTRSRAKSLKHSQVICQLCDRQLSDYSTVDAGKVRDALIGRGLSVLSVRRVFTIVKAVINLAIAEHGLDIRNAFAAIYMPEAESKNCVSTHVETIGRIQQSCEERHDDMQWLIAFISDTGMRVAEAEGLHINNGKLDGDIQALICN